MSLTPHVAARLIARAGTEDQITAIEQDLYWDMLQQEWEERGSDDDQ